MSCKIELIKAKEVNGVAYKKGDILNVSHSIYENLTKSGIAKDYKSKQKKED